MRLPLDPPPGLAEKRSALEAWAGHLDGLVHPDSGQGGAALCTRMFAFSFAFVRTLGPARGRCRFDATAAEVAREPKNRRYGLAKRIRATGQQAIAQPSWPGDDGASRPHQRSPER
jgi:hypothetical protein